MTLTMLCDLLIIVAGIKLSWDVIGGNVVSVKKVYNVIHQRIGPYWKKLCPKSYIPCGFSSKIRPFKDLTAQYLKIPGLFNRY